jgi:hypothetical protein
VSSPISVQRADQVGTAYHHVGTGIVGPRGQLDDDVDPPRAICAPADPDEGVDGRADLGPNGR